MRNSVCAVFEVCALLMASTSPVFAGASTATPEPATFLLIAGGLTVVLGMRRYRNRNR